MRNVTISALCILSEPTVAVAVDCVRTRDCHSKQERKQSLFPNRPLASTVPHIFQPICQPCLPLTTLAWPIEIVEIVPLVPPESSHQATHTTPPSTKEDTRSNRSSSDDMGKSLILTPPATPALLARFPPADPPVALLLKGGAAKMAATAGAAARSSVT